MATLVDARPAALVNGRSILWGDLRPILGEAAGALALRETILDRRIELALEEEHITISADDVSGEQRRLLASLSDDRETAIRLLDDLRARQGLGPVRMHALLWRNAAMRALVSGRVDVTEAAVTQLYDAMHGPRRQARLITVSTLAEAEGVVSRIQGGEFFGDVAVEVSTDASAARGGLLQPVSRLDPSYPAPLREAIWSLAAVGDVSAPTLLDDGYAVVQLVREVEADGVSLEDARADVERLVRLNQERLLMDRYAKRILNDSSVTVFDDSLKDSWERSRQ